MTIKSTCTAAALAAAFLLPNVAMTTGAIAQTQTPVSGAQAQPAAPGGDAKSVPGHKPNAMAPKPVSRSERVEQHIKQLHTELKITPDQQAQWDQFAQVMRENAKDMDQVLEQRGTKFASMSAAEDLQSYAQLAQQHAQDTQKLAAAFQTLYNSMPAEQKKNADAVFRARADRGKHRHG